MRDPSIRPARHAGSHPCAGGGRALRRRAGCERTRCRGASRPAASSLPYHLTGGLSAGYRLVDVDGSRDKYDEDYNLQPGGRVFLFTLDGEARDPDKPPLPLDRFHLEVDTPGDEPASRFALDAEDRALWSLRADFIRSKYFYDVPSLFAEPVAGDIRLNDLHAFDLTRTNGLAELRVHPTRPAHHHPRLPALRARG